MHYYYYYYYYGKTVNRNQEQKYACYKHSQKQIRTNWKRILLLFKEQDKKQKREHDKKQKREQNKTQDRKQGKSQT